MKVSLLILDGDRWHRETLATALGYEGFHAEHTGDATSALELLARHRFQLVLLDPSASATGGWKTVERMLLLNPDLPMIVFVPDEGDPRSTPLTGASRIIKKSVDFFTLLGAIERALSPPVNPHPGREEQSCSDYLRPSFRINENTTMKTASTSGTGKARSARSHAKAAAQREPSSLLASTPSVYVKRILLVDDDPTVRGSLSDVLVSEGYVVIPAGDGQQALELAASTPVDLVLLDLNMPVKNGWDTFERLSVDHPLVPVIIITARPNQFFTALGAGVGALLEKPLEIPVFLNTISRLLTEPYETRLARLAGSPAEFCYARSNHDGRGGLGPNGGRPGA